MKRRKAFSIVSFGIGSIIVAPGILLSGCKPNVTDNGLLSVDDIATLDEVGETILPATASSPGAKAVGIGDFINMYVSDCYDIADQQILKNGIDNLNTRSTEEYGRVFGELSPRQRKDLLSAMDQEAKTHSSNRDKGDSEHYFSMLKELVLFGYFTSEIGATQELRYIKVPGHYDGDIPYKKGDKAWA